MKKIICIVLSVFFIFTLISCDDTEENNSYSYAHSTVYVSNYGKIHSNPDCSGMKYYTAMSLDSALDAGYVLCKNCYSYKELKKAETDDCEPYSDAYEAYYYLSSWCLRTVQSAI